MVTIPLPPGDSLRTLTDDDLYWSMVALEYGCLRSKAITREKHRTYVCALERILRVEANRRGSKVPDFPHDPYRA